MIKFRSLIKFIIGGYILPLLLSCNHKPDYTFHLIKVDSIQVPTPLSANVPFEIKFFGTIAGNGCHSFYEFKVNQVNNDLLIEAWEKADAKALLCPTVMVYLTGHNLTTQIQSAGDYNIKIKQPDNSYLEKQVRVN